MTYRQRKEDDYGSIPDQDGSLLNQMKKHYKMDTWSAVKESQCHPGYNASVYIYIISIHILICKCHSFCINRRTYQSTRLRSFSYK